jgi:hypothetical protein
VFQAVAEPGNRHGESEGCCPRRHTVELRLNGAVSIALYDAWAEVRVTICRDLLK